MIIATAGHVDHGKTALVRALTGVDTDRLPEEKQRGLTIDLGFAYQVLDGCDLGFIDVPGHERFLRNMLAGVNGIDTALLVVAADDGPMPQTYEHLAILDLLGVHQGAVAITKIDRVDAVRLASAEQEVRAALSTSGLADAPIFPVAAHRGKGIAALRDWLGLTAKALPARMPAGNFRLCIDRCFTIPGAGLIVTGTALSGRIQVGDHLALSPQGVPVRVRGIRTYDRPADEARAGQRCALNIAGAAGASVAKSDVQRGDWIVAQDAYAPAQHVDCRIRLLPSEARPLKHWTPVHIHIGAADIPGRIALLSGQQIEPGTDDLAQVIFDRPTIAARGDRLVLRDQSARRTIGGGIVLDPFASPRGRSRPDRHRLLAGMEQRSAAGALEELLSSQSGAIDLEWFRRAWNLTQPEAADLFGQAQMRCVIRAEERFGLAPSQWQALATSILETLQQWHTRHPERLGMAEADLARGCPVQVPLAVLSAVVGELLREQAVQRRGGKLLHLPSHLPEPTPLEAAMWGRVHPRLMAAGLRPPRVRELASELGVSPEEMERFLRRACDLGLVVQVSTNRFFLPETLAALAAIADALSAETPDGEFDPGPFRDRSGIGRNLTIEVLEHFDKAGLTTRRGNRRRLCAPVSAVFN